MDASTRSPRRRTTDSGNPLDGCTIRTDSHGTAYVFGVGTLGRSGTTPSSSMSRSTNGGDNWSRAAPVAGPVDAARRLRPGPGRPVIDGVAGARSDLAPAPSVDIANGAPTGAGCDNRIVMTYVSGDDQRSRMSIFTESTDRRRPPGRRRGRSKAGDRGFYTAPAISPDGRDVYVVYNAFTTPYRRHDRDTAIARRRRQARDAAAGGADRRFSEIHRARRATRAGRARTTSRPSSSATTSTPPPRGPTARPCGTTPGTRRTARRSTPGGRRWRTATTAAAGAAAGLPGDLRQLRHLVVHDGSLKGTSPNRGEGGPGGRPFSFTRSRERVGATSDRYLMRTTSP